MPSLQDVIPFVPPTHICNAIPVRRIRPGGANKAPAIPTPTSEPSTIDRASYPVRPTTRLPVCPQLRPTAGPLVCHAVAGAVGVTAVPAGSSGLAALLTGHLLQDGELVLLILKPSRWFIILSSLRFAAVVLILMLGAAVFDDRIPGPATAAASAGAVLITFRLTWAVLQWVGRLYILTDMRIVRLDGVFSINIFDCPLRRVATTRVFRSARERFVRLGSIDIFADDEFGSFSTWQMVRKPKAVHDEILEAISRAKQGCRRREGQSG